MNGERVKQSSEHNVEISVGGRQGRRKFNVTVFWQAEQKISAKTCVYHE